MIRTLSLLAAFPLAAPLHAKPPEFGALFPPGGQRGTTFTVTSTVKNTPETQWWTDAPGVSFTATDQPEKWQITIPATTPIGLYQIARLNAEGVSNTRWFTIGDLPEIDEIEPNDEKGKRQAIQSLPVCVNARLGKANDVDGYQITLKTGQTLGAMVESYSIGSAADLHAHILNPAGQRIFTASDSRNLDPFLNFTAPADGTYTLQIAGFAHPPQANINFAGGNAIVYRLHLTTGPVVTHFHPPAVSTTQPTQVSLQGYNLDPTKVQYTIDPKAPRHSGNILLVDIPGHLTPLQAIPCTSAPATEHEPNDGKEQATPIPAGIISGVISHAADIDRFSITMEKGQKLQARIHSHSIGLPLDATLKVEGPDGKQITTNDDGNGKPDPQLQWTAAAAGVYQLVVEDTLQQGGSGHHYVLEIDVPEPSVESSIASAAPLAVAAGESTSVKLTVKRLNGHKIPLVARVSGLPAGVSAPDVPIGEKDAGVEIKLITTKDTPQGNHRVSFALHESAPTTGDETAAVKQSENIFPTSIPLRGELLRGTSLLDEVDGLWLTVKPAK